MRIRMRNIVSEDDFGDLSQYSSLSKLDILAMVAEKASEKEGFSQPLSLDIPFIEEQPIIVPHHVTNSKSELKKVPDLPRVFKEEISKLGGNDPNLVIQKELSKSDVDPDYSRVSMPENDSRMWLTQEEKRLLDVRDEKGKLVGFEVQVIDTGLKVREVILKKWSYTNTVSYVLVKYWNEIVADNGLKKGDLVQIWSFRVHGKLGFALVKLQKKSFDVQWGIKRRRTN